MTYPEAKKALKKIGVSKATGDTYRASMAPAMALGCCLGKKAEEKIYLALQKCKDDESIRRQVVAWQTDPLSAMEVL